jgi:oxygen-dependent protoporphyrinogen oxidase
LDEGWIVETGPNTLQLEGAEDEALMAAYGLGEVMQSADMRAARRYIFARGELHGLGPSPLTLLTSKLLSWGGKLRLLSEPFRAKGGHTGETVVEFATRRFGPEAAAMLMDPIVSGVHAGNPARLVMASCFPRIHALEKTYGSVLNGLRRGPKTKRTVVGFPGGMRQLAETMASRLPAEDLRLGVVTTSLRRDARGWNVAWRGPDGADEGVSAKHLIVTAPCWHWGSLPFDETVTPFLRDWENPQVPPVTVVARGYAREDVPHPLDGFGYLTPGGEHRDVLGCLFPSCCSAASSAAIADRNSRACRTKRSVAWSTPNSPRRSASRKRRPANGSSAGNAPSLNTTPASLGAKPRWPRPKPPIPGCISMAPSAAASR